MPSGFSFYCHLTVPDPNLDLVVVNWFWTKTCCNRHKTLHCSTGASAVPVYDCSNSALPHTHLTSAVTAVVCFYPHISLAGLESICLWSPCCSQLWSQALQMRFYSVRSYWKVFNHCVTRYSVNIRTTFFLSQGKPSSAEYFTKDFLKGKWRPFPQNTQ